MGHRLGDFLAAAALETLRINDHQVLQVLDATVAQNFAALT